MQQAAERIGVSKKTVYGWVYGGKLMPYAKVGRRLVLVCVEVDGCARELAPDERGEPGEGAIRTLVEQGAVMTSAEVATVLGISRSTVRTMTAKNMIRPLRRNTRPLVFEAEPIWDVLRQRNPPVDVAAARARWLSACFPGSNQAR